MHSIQKTIMLDKDSPIKTVGPEKREVTIRNDLERYILECSKGLSVLSTSYDKAKLSLDYIKTTQKSPPAIENISFDEFLEFNIENYFIRSHAIYDRSLIFVGRLHDLGLSDESISHELLVTNYHVKKSGLAAKLKTLRKKCTEYRLDRNKIVHHGRYADEIFDSVSLMHQANYMHELSGEEKPFTDQKVDFLTKELIEIKSEEFQEYLDSIKVALVSLYDVAEKVYLDMRNRVEKYNKAIHATSA